MILHHKTEVCAVDGRKLLLFVNEGDTAHPDLQVIHLDEQENPPAREQGTSRPGRVAQSAGARRSAYEETDFQKLAETDFAVSAAETLNKRALANCFDKLIVIASPKTLGELRQHYHKALAERIVGEIDKEATNLPPAGIAAMIDAA